MLILENLQCRTILNNAGTQVLFEMLIQRWFTSSKQRDRNLTRKDDEDKDFVIILNYNRNFS